jgi:hypothetical protein
METSSIIVATYAKNAQFLSTNAILAQAVLHVPAAIDITDLIPLMNVTSVETISIIAHNAQLHQLV